MATKIRPAFPAKGPEPTIAQALAAGTKIILSPMFVADVAAIQATDADAWARADLLAQRASGRHGSLRDPRDGQNGYMNDGPWLKAKATHGRKLARMFKGMAVDQLVALTEDPAFTWSLVEERITAARRCYHPEERAA